MNMTSIATLFSLTAFGWGYFNHHRAKELETKLENIRHSHYRLADKTREQLGELENETELLKQKLRSLNKNEDLYHADMTIGQAIALDPHVAEILGAFHIGGCSSCTVNPDDTLAHAAISNGQEAEKVLLALNKLNSHESHEIIKMLERQPNVQLTL
jgi:hypothetical protein